MPRAVEESALRFENLKSLASTTSWSGVSTTISAVSSRSGSSWLSSSTLSIGSSVYRRTAAAPAKDPLLCACVGESAHGHNVEMADTKRQFGDVYDVHGSVTSGGSDHQVLHKCRHKATGALFLVRTIDTEQLARQARSSEKLRARQAIANNVLIMRRVKHPNIVAVVDIFHDTEHVHVVMERCLGTRIFDPIIAASSYSEKEAAIIVEQILQGLAHMHANNIVHKNLKPESFQYSRPGLDLENNILKITDLSAACICEPGVRMREKAAAAGNPYTAPELMAGKNYDTQSDIWSVGVLTCNLLSGWSPFLGESVKDIEEKTKNGLQLLTGASWRTVTREAKAVVRRTLVADPALRLTASTLLTEPWVRDHASMAKTTIFSGDPTDFGRRLKNLYAVQQDQKSVLHVVADALDEAQLADLRQAFDQGQMTLKDMKRRFKHIGLKEFRLDPLKVVQEGAAGEDMQACAEFVAASQVEWDVSMRDEALFTTFRHIEDDKGGVVIPGQIQVISHDGCEAGADDRMLVNPLTVDIVAWMNRSEPDLSDLRKLLAMLRGNRYF